jgi:hypothetical protein
MDGPGCKCSHESLIDVLHETCRDCPCKQYLCILPAYNFHFILARKQIKFSMSLYRDCLKIITASVIMGIVLYLFILHNFWQHGLNTNSLIMLSACIIAGTVAYFAVLYISGIRPAKFSRREESIRMRNILP